MLRNKKRKKGGAGGRRVLFWRGLVPLLSFVSWRFGVLRELPDVLGETVEKSAHFL